MVDISLECISDFQIVPMKAKTRKKLVNRSAKNIRKIDIDESQNIPHLIKIGAISRNADVVEYMSEMIITPDHLLVLSEMLLDNMWTEASHGTPNDERVKILRDLQFDIHRFFEIAMAAKTLASRKSKATNLNAA